MKSFGQAWMLPPQKLQMVNYELGLECLDWAAESVQRSQSEPWGFRHPTLSTQRLQEGNGAPCPRNGLHSSPGSGQRGQSKGDTAWDSPGVTFSAQGGQAVPTAASNLVLVGPEHSEARAALVTHITKIVFTAFIHLHLYSCEWQVFVPHMEGTLGEAVFRYLLTILWKDIQSVNFQIKFEHYNEK